MATSSSGIHITKHLLICAMPIPDSVALLFTMVFCNLSELLKYVCKDITKTDTFHLLIPLDYLEDLLNDTVFQFPQVRHIDIYYDDIVDLAQIQRRLNLTCERLHFCSVHDLLRLLESIAFDNSLVSSDPIDRNTINALISSIKDRISAKRSITSARHSQVLKKFASNFLYGFPVKNINNIDPSFICPSCKLLFKQPYQLECRHRKCIVCLNIQKSCTTCFTIVSRDKVRITTIVYHYFVLLRSFCGTHIFYEGKQIWFDHDLQISMQNLTTSCLSCEWRGLLKAYEEHLKQNHHQLLTCIVHNLQVDDDNTHQPCLIEPNQQITSLNGTCVWKLSGIDAIINNAAADQRKSIYSSPFYSFPNGYKICLRIYLNGDAKARGTHMSIFFVLMRGNFDGNLQWPFKFKVTFTLLNHLSSDDNQSKFFWPDTESICFQRPRSNMNIAYGISKLFSLDLFKKNQNQYVQNDTLFIRVEVDCLAERPTLPLIAGAGELPTEEEHADGTYDNLSCLLRDSDAL